MDSESQDSDEGVELSPDLGKQELAYLKYQLK